MIKDILLKFKYNQQGVVVLEFFFSIIFLLLLLFFMIDLALIRGNTGKLDNLSYSLVNILRERTQLYREKDIIIRTLSNADVETYRRIAKSMFYGDPDDKRPLYVVLDSLQFERSPLDEKPVLNQKLSHQFGDISECEPTTDLWDITNLAPRSEVDYKFVLPIYQVTVCVPTYSIFKSFTAGEHYANGMLRSSSISVGR